jgi:hypothetical protein
VVPVEHSGHHRGTDEPDPGEVGRGTVRPSADLVAGQGLQRLLCTARALGVTVTVLAGPVELGEPELSGVPGGKRGLMPQVLMQVTPPDGA